MRRGRRVTGPGRGTRGRRQHHLQPNLARNLSRSFFETPQKRCNSNAMNSMFELVEGELRAKLLVDSHGRTTSRRAEPPISTPGLTGVEGARKTGGPGCGAGGRWAAAGPGRTTHRHPDRLEAAARPAGPGRASSRRAERSSRRGRRAGPTAPGTPATQPTETPAAQQQEHRGPSQRNTGGAAARTPGPSQRNTGGAAAATRVCERPGGESPPPGLYARITCR